MKADWRRESVPRAFAEVVVAGARTEERMRMRMRVRMGEERVCGMLPLAGSWGSWAQGGGRASRRACSVAAAAGGGPTARPGQILCRPSLGTPALLSQLVLRKWAEELRKIRSGAKSEV